MDEVTHWIGDAPTSLHGNGAASFEHTTRDESAVTCRLCISILAHHAEALAMADANLIDWPAS